MRVGGGIVADSRPKDEFKECGLKGAFLRETMPEFALIETMLLENGIIKYLGRHLQRLKKSARYFSIACPVDQIKTALEAYAAKQSGRIRLRLLLKPDGDFLIRHQIAARFVNAHLLRDGTGSALIVSAEHDDFFQSRGVEHSQGFRGFRAHRVADGKDT